MATGQVGAKGMEKKGRIEQGHEGSAARCYDGEVRVEGSKAGVRCECNAAVVATHGTAVVWPRRVSGSQDEACQGQRHGLGQRAQEDSPDMATARPL